MSTQRNLEALLFVVGEEGISLEELSYLLDETTATTYEMLETLEAHYGEIEDCALHIMETGNHFVLTTKKACAPLLKKYAQSPISNNLSQAALETLSIIAYKQPITRMQIDEIRGVQSSGAVQKLVARQLIQEKGRVEGPGRAILYGTTPYFMDFFALKSLEELPAIDDMEMELEAEMPFDLFYNRYNKTDLALEEENEASDAEEVLPESTELEEQ
ncbi:segregation and condensation protein B [Enterococcus sp. PF1-24]|uniref:SMC-Scp complex subunit ScpB n=1 Tax=unclassified Enterococcus TaxID=2608891 RepID=UPI002476B38A|nr:MULTISPECIES: SMC-Scp complex subunit ScpB [unclassified Enterococcus]MDH6364929.1 segregation and condensation protein B [Enterococcus sp. PFB1-1]MDH6402030.1 segregation and condensation protein B [Enterococcus sp. PF1-24]